MAEVWVAGVATLAAGALAADAARDAGRSSQAGYDRATEESARQYDQSREDQMTWLESGRNALAGIDRLNSGDASAFFKDPGYNFRLDQGVNALDRSASADGSLGSGGHSVDLMQYGQGFASNEYGNFYNRLAGVAGVGQSAAQNLGALGANAANAQGQYAINAGNSRASGYLAQGDMYGDAIAGIGGNFGNYLQGQSNRNGGGSPWYIGKNPGEGLSMANLLALNKHIMNEARIGGERGTQQYLGGLASQAMTAPQQEQPALYAKMAATDPQFAQQQQAQGAETERARAMRLAEKARYFVGMAESGNEQAVATIYPQLAQEARSLGMGEVPMQYAPEMLPALKQLAALGQQRTAPPAEVATFQAMTAGLPEQERERARRIQLGLDPRANNPNPQLFTDANGNVMWLTPPGAGGPTGPAPGPAASRDPVPTSTPNRGPGSLDLNADLEQFASLGVPVSSTRRTPERNKEVGGVGNSFHLTGEAVDFVPRTPQEKQQTQEYWRGRGYQVIDEGDHLHVEPPGRGMTASQLGAGPAAAAGVTRVPGVAGKTKEGGDYSNLSAEEVAAMGLPIGTVAQRSPNGQVQIVNKPRDLPTGGQVIDNGDGTTTYIPAGKISEGERNASGFYQRMVSANGEMERLLAAGYDPTNRRDFYTAGGDILNPLATSEGQQFQQAKSNWVRANLRKESGAAIGVDEMAQEIKTYFPIPGDSSEQIAQKARARQVTERAMRQAAGGGLAPPTATPKPAQQQPVQRARNPQTGEVLVLRNGQWVPE